MLQQQVELLCEQRPFPWALVFHQSQRPFALILVLQAKECAGPYHRGRSGLGRGRQSGYGAAVPSCSGCACLGFASDCGNGYGGAGVTGYVGASGCESGSGHDGVCGRRNSCCASVASIYSVSASDYGYASPHQLAKIGRASCRERV